MTERPMDALRHLRDALRDPKTTLPNVEALTTELSSALDLLSTSVPAQDIGSIIKAIDRLLEGIQQTLAVTIIPTFLHLLDERGAELLDRFFVPPKTATKGTLGIARTVALKTYLTLPALLSTKNKDLALPMASRGWVLKTMQKLAQEHGFDDVYWAVWSEQSDEGESSKRGSMKMLQWEEAVKAVLGAPAKVANAVGRWKEEAWQGDVPESLSARPYFDQLIRKLEPLMYELSQTPDTGHSSAIRLIIHRLITLGLLSSPPKKDYDPMPALLPAFLPGLLVHLHPPSISPLPPYGKDYLPHLFLGLPTSILSTFVRSILDHLSFGLSSSGVVDLRPEANASVRRASIVLADIIGPAPVKEEGWEALIQAVMESRITSLSDMQTATKVRIAVALIAVRGTPAIEAALSALMESWTDPKYIRFSLYAHQFSMTFALLLLIGSLPAFNHHLVRLSHDPRFLMAMQSYLGHPDPSIRRLGMLVAEIVSERTIEEDSTATDLSYQEGVDELKAGLEADTDDPKPKRQKRSAKRLKFGAGMWDGHGEGREEARWLRSMVGVHDCLATLEDDPTGELWLLGWDKIKTTATRTEAPQSTVINEISTASQQRHSAGEKRAKPQSTSKNDRKNTQPKIVMLDDDQVADPLQGYRSHSRSSSRSPSPDQAFLDEVAADPSLALDAAGKKKIHRPVYVSQLLSLLRERESPDHLEMALRHGESLIRAKRSFGTELEDNATKVAQMVVALNDPFDLQDFDDQRQGILNALVACLPRNVAPFLCETYFTGQYSLNQRSVILTGLAMGARELAGMTVPTAPKTRRIDFPSKQLPPALHQKYISPTDTAYTGQLEEAIGGVRGLLLSKGARKGEETVPELARQKRLRLGPQTTRKMAEVGTLAERQTFPGANTDLRQIPVVPFREVAGEFFIMPLINGFWQHLQDASIRQSRAMESGSRYRGAGAGLILSPMALEKFLMTLALLLHAARHSPLFLAVLGPEALELAATIGARHPSAPNESNGTETESHEASVVGAALEIALVVLDASFELDGGRTLALDKSHLLLGVGEWASSVFQAEEMGGTVASGQGGLREGRVRAAAAGVVVKVSEIGEKWGRMDMIA